MPEYPRGPVKKRVTKYMFQAADISVNTSANAGDYWGYNLNDGVISSVVFAIKVPENAISLGNIYTIGRPAADIVGDIYMQVWLTAGHLDVGIDDQDFSGDLFAFGVTDNKPTTLHFFDVSDYSDFDAGLFIGISIVRFGDDVLDTYENKLELLGIMLEYDVME